MTVLNPIIPDSSGLFAKKHSEDKVLAKIHQATAQTMRHFNQNIKWLMAQVKDGHLDKEQISDLTLKSLQDRGTHKSPVEIALQQCYADAKFVSLIENAQMDLPSHNIHLIGLGLTFNRLSVNADFPPVCHNDNTEEFGVSTSTIAATA